MRHVPDTFFLQNNKKVIYTELFRNIVLIISFLSYTLAYLTEVVYISTSGKVLYASDVK